MKSVLNSRRISLAAAIVAAVVMATSLSANELNDGTITIPRSGKEIVSLPSPEAAELCRHIDHAIDYSTGCVSLSFPLYTYNCGGISLPISISYRTGGIKADTEPGALGVGWELNCGGFVSRSVVGMPDDAPGVEFSTSKTTFEFLKKLHSNTADAMYDRYSFSAGGYSGSFIIVGNAIMHLTPTDALVVRTASGFDITTPDGTLYRYDIPETLDYKYQPSSISNATSFPHYICDCMWRLSKIESPSRQDCVTFAYDTIDKYQRQYYQRSIAASWESKQNIAKWETGDVGVLKPSTSYEYGNRHRIASISGRGGTVTFSYGYSDSRRKERCTGITVENNQGDIVRQISFTPGQDRNWRTLSSYRITDAGDNLLDGAEFTYFPALWIDLTDDDKKPEKDFFGYPNGGGEKSGGSSSPDSLVIIEWPVHNENNNDETYDSALDKLLRPSWKRQPVFDYTLSESLRTVSTVAGTKTEFEYEPNDGGNFLATGRISPGVRLKTETVTDFNTGNERIRTLTYSAPVPSVDFSILQDKDFISVSGTYSGSSASTYMHYSTGATLTASCRLQGASPENACVYYGKVTETITGTGIDEDAPIVTDYEYDTTRACSKLFRHNNSWSSTDPRVAGAYKTYPQFSGVHGDDTPGWVYIRMLTVNPVRGYFEEIIGDRAPLKQVTHWRTLPSGQRNIWRRTEYHNTRDTTMAYMGFYSENVIRIRGGLTSPDTYAWENYDFKSVDDFNRFSIHAKTVKVYVDSITDTEYDELGTAHTVIRRMGYNNEEHVLKWETGKKELIFIPIIPLAYGFHPLDSMMTYLPDPKIAGTRLGNNSLLKTCVIGCGDEWIRADYVYSSSSDTEQMRRLDAAHRLSLPVETYYTTGHGFEYDSTAVSERFTYVNGRGTYDMRLASDVIRSKTDGVWYTIDSIAVGAHDSYGNPLLVRRNGGTPSYYGWSHGGTTLSFAATAGQKTTYTWEPLIGCTSSRAPSGLTTDYTYSGSRLSAVSVGGTLLKSYSYSVHGTSSGRQHYNCVNEETVIDGTSRSVNTRTYFDGFGNRIGSVTADKAWGTAIATRDDYDAAGRLIRSYTPRPASTPFDVLTAENPSGDAVPYSVITYSGSSDSRPLSTTIAGEEYRGHPSQTRHLFSRAHNGVTDSVLTCRRYRPGATSGAVTLAGYYPKGALSVEEVTDGDGRRALTFTDYRGRLILTRSLMDAGVDLKSVQPGRWTDTYNVYDDAGNLLYVVTPAVAPEMSSVGSTWSADDGDSSPLAQCFSYEYDGRMRLRSKKAPDAAAVKYWYDATGALVLSQDGSQRSRGVCSFAIADSLGRAAVSGECNFSDALAAEVEGRHVVATRGTDSGNLNGYEPNIPLSSPDIFSSSYYDDYSFLSLDCFSRLLDKLSDHPLPSHKASPVGLPTGTFTKVLEAVSNLSLIEPFQPGELEPYQPVDGHGLLLPSDSDDYFPSTITALCYDDRDRLIATVTSDHLDGLCHDTSTLNDGGMPLTKHFTRWPLSDSEETEDHTYTYVYDNLGRVASLTLTRGDSVYTVQTNAYDAIGRLNHTAYGNGCGISFGYKVAGALASITAANVAGKSTFSQTLHYATGNTPSYSGNIGSIDWQGDDKVRRRYNFAYDGLGRLTSAAYTEPTGRTAATPVVGTPSYSTSYSYGLDSRPLTVRRLGVRAVVNSDNLNIPDFGEVDNLTFSYTGSRLTKVQDAAEDIIYAGATDFDDAADSDKEYTYDVDGRLTSDANKGITSIKYNAIGLPAKVTFSDGSTIINRYGADGTLLQREKEVQGWYTGLRSITFPGFNSYSIITMEDHIGPLTFNDGGINVKHIRRKLARLDTPNGFIASGKMHYYVKDYQGNVRQVTDTDGVVEQDNHYYPYGMLMGESSNILASARGYKGVSFNPYLFGSKEYLTTAGANLLDFTARTYDPTTLLFHTQDPKATDYTSLNSYLYCGGNPINYIDPTGEIIDTPLDIGFTIYDGIAAAYNFITGDYDAAKENLVDLTIDAAAIFIPGVSAGINKLIKVLDKAEDIVKTADHATDAVKVVDHATDAVKTVDKASDANKGLKNADRIAEGNAFEKEQLQYSIDQGKDVVGHVTLVPENGLGNVKGNRTVTDQLIRNSDGTYSAIETKLTGSTQLSKGQRAAQTHIGKTGGWFEVRSTVNKFGLNPNDRIYINKYTRIDKYP